jgi:hypothetical protein
MTTVTLDKERGVEVLNASLRAISDTITERGGKADVKMAPKVVTLRDDTDLQAIMDRYLSFSFVCRPHVTSCTVAECGRKMRSLTVM